MFHQYSLLQFVSIALFLLGGVIGAVVGLHFTLFIWAIGFVLFILDFVLEKKAIKRQKLEFLLNFENEDLCTHKQTPDFVYRVLGQNGPEVEIQPIWSHGKPQMDRQPIRADLDAILPFNERAFLEFS